MATFHFFSKQKYAQWKRNTFFVHAISIGSFPFQDPFTATLAPTLLKNTETKPLEFEMEFDPSRNRVSSLENRHRQHVRLWLNKGSKHLIINLPGVGGDASSGALSFIAEQMSQQLNANVLSVPNPFHWRYVLGVHPSDSYPGFSTRDARIYSHFLQFVLRDLKNRTGLQYDRISLVGYSLGGWFVPFLSQELETKLDAPLVKVVSINPPKSLALGSRAIDKLYFDGKTYSPAQKEHIMGYIIELILTFSQYSNWNSSLTGLASDMRLSQRQTRWTIGNVFRKDLGSIIYVSQQLSDRGVLKTKDSWWTLSARVHESNQFSFQDYLTKMVFPSVELGPYFGGQDQRRFDYENDLEKLSPLLAHDQRYFVLHTQDDFLNDPQYQKWMLDTYGSRSFFFEKGGHLGQIWTPEFLKVFLSLLQ